MVRRYGVLGLGAALVLAVLLWWLPVLRLPWLWAWLGAINLVAFVMFGYDKQIAGSRWSRIPERVLLLLTALGGVFGGLLGMVIFRHKTRKTSFRLRFLLAALFAVALFGILFYLTRPLA